MRLDGLWYPQVALFALLIIATYGDLRERRIPNGLLIIGAGLALLLSLLMQSIPLQGLLAGGLAGLLVFMPFYVKSMMGAGDIKLMVVVGMFLGVKGVLVSALLTALAGGVLALGFALSRTKTRLPYAVAILAGVTGYVVIGYADPIILNFPLQVF